MTDASDDKVKTEPSVAVTSEPMTNSDSLMAVVSNLVDERHVMQMIDSQTNMLARFEKSNEMLVNVNALAVIRFDAANRDLKRYTQQLCDLQKDLDSVYHRIKFLRLKLAQQYPQAFKACGNVFNPLDEEEETTEDMKGIQLNDS
ncbi:unnamed protein product [Oppiella nova]|uniref:KxDL domain-containing protein n=1 Tax=Oppiella nova TaxID=334625 RepID=A0A7R9MK85_9ACAR|nr:unnamed protein product [Oppiella nova]CAG2178790.1 unnamed protein product [Oppiella nova]